MQTIKLEASDRSQVENPSAKQVFDQITEQDVSTRQQINGSAAQMLVDKYEEGRSQILGGIAKIASTLGTLAVIGVLPVLIIRLSC